MRVAIVGAHGKIAMRLTSLLVAGGDSVSGLIRNPDHADDVRRQGADPVVCDLEQATVQQVAAAITSAEVAVFAAGAGAGSGADRKLSMDRDGAVKLLQAAVAAEVPRYVIISSVGAENPPDDDDVFSVYLRAKAEADQAVQASDRDWTIVRPGALTDDPGTGRVRLDSAPFRGRVSRDDVAAVLAGLLHDPRASHRLLYVNGGDEPIEPALESALHADVT
jgi:nucleoside-diphosphate-sugar epimerase